jgi:hypothetical protein
MLSVAATSRGHWTDGSCVIDNLLNSRLSLSATFISDLVLITVMISGVLRWKGTHGIGGTWWLLYKQVSLHHPADRAGTGSDLLILLILLLGLGLDRTSHTCRDTCRGAC